MEGAGLDPVDLCLFRCLPQMGVLRPDGVFLPTGVCFPLPLAPLFWERFSSDVEVLKLVSAISNSSSGSGESRNNSSTEGVSAPEGK